MLDDVEVVGEASNGQEGLRLVSALARDAVVLDREALIERADHALRTFNPGKRERRADA